MGQEVSGDHEHLGMRLGGVRPVLAVRSRDPPDRLIDQRHRKPESDDLLRRPGRGPFFNERAAPKMRLPRHPRAQPDRQRQSPIGHPLGTRAQRF